MCMCDIQKNSMLCVGDVDGGAHGRCASSAVFNLLFSSLTVGLNVCESYSALGLALGRLTLH